MLVAASLGVAVAIIPGPLAQGAIRSTTPTSGGGGLGSTSSTGTTTTATTTTATTTTGTGTTTVTGPTTTPYPISTTTTTPTPTTTTPVTITKGPPGNPLTTRGMWIWVLASSNYGNPASIITQAKRYGVSTVFVKAGDGTTVWPQFSQTLVSTLNAAHLHVCAWQFVYGQHPVLEAEVGAQAVANGANCLVIDAESAYQGKYVQAQTYMQKLRQLVGANYPIALAGFPYVDYHPGFPYSVFLGPGGAQYNTPQMYWKDIGTTVDDVYAHTYAFNDIYQRPIEPLGQVFDSPSAEQIHRFRSMSRSYRSPGVSWWDWQSAATKQWRQISQPVAGLKGFTPDSTLASLGKGALGDLVVWAQEHLVSAGESVAVDGDFGPLTKQAVETFQQAHALTITGVINSATWVALLHYPPVAVTWVIKKKQLVAETARASRGAAEVLQVPKSATQPARRDEIAGAGGAGSP
jgi:peptidoglycan hydrolase-like protein with peptidoglycan-binding domain